MSRRPAKRAFGARPSDADTWVLAPEILSSRDAESRLFTPRLTIDVTPDQRGRIKVTAFQPQIPLFGPMFFNHQPMVYVSWALLAAVWWFLYRSRMGLKLLAVGESPASAHALGLPVNAIRYGATLFGGAMAGTRRHVSGRHVYADVGRRHDGRARVDRAGSRGVRHVETGACGVGRLSVRRHHRRAIGGPKPRRSYFASTPVHAAVSSHNCRSGLHFERQATHAPQHTSLAGHNLPTGGLRMLSSHLVAHKACLRDQRAMVPTTVDDLATTLVENDRQALRFDAAAPPERVLIAIERSRAQVMP